jgi:outer membrane usher protein
MALLISLFVKGRSGEATPMTGLTQASDPVRSVVATNASPADLFQKAFGDVQKVEEGDVPLDLVLDGDRLGELPVSLKESDGSISAGIQAALLFERLKGVLNDETEVRLRNELQGREQVTPEMLRALGWGADVDLTSIQLVLKIPPNQRKPRKFRFMRLEPPIIEGERLVPEEWNAHVNLYVSAGYDYGTSVGSTSGFDPVSLRAPLAVRLREVVFEADTAYTEDARDPMAVERARFVHDQEDSLLRWTFGDVFTTAVGYQRSVQVGGLSVGRQWSLQPYNSSIPQGEVNLLITEPSEVEIWANGRLLQRFNLNPGQYSFADFPLVFGENNVEILLRDRSGRVQVIQQNVVYDRRLLAAGLVDWAITAGFPSQQDGVLRTYDGDDMQVTGYYRRPLGESVTGGINTQANGYRQMTGVDALWVSRAGAVTGDAALSRSTDDSGYAFGVGYRAAQNLGSASFLNAFNASLQYRSEAFGTLGQMPAYQGTGLVAGLGATVPIPGKMRLGVVGSRSFGRGRTPDVTSAGLNVGKRFRNGLDVRVTANWAYPTARKEDWSIGLVLTFIPSVRMSEDRPMDFYRASSRYPEEEFTASWQRTYGAGVGAATYALDWQSRQDDWNQSVQARFFDERAIVSLGHVVTGSRSPAEASHRTRVSVGTAVVLAGGAWALTQPVNDSFVLVPRGEDGGPAPYFGDADGPIRSWTSDWAWLGPRVDVRQSSYLVNQVSVYPPQADETGSLQVREYGFRPRYRSAAVIHVGFVKSVGVVGRLLGADGEPMAFRKGRMTPVQSEDTGAPGSREKDAFEFVMGAEGEFEIPDVQPARYEIRVSGDEDLRWQVDVNDTGDLVDVGVVRPDTQEMEENRK